MHVALSLRLHWIMKKIRTSMSQGDTVRLLDIGRFWLNSDQKEEILNQPGVEYTQLKPESTDRQESIARESGWNDIAADQFDIVISTHAFAHTPYPWRTMEEIHRVLKPGGKVFVIEPGLSEKLRGHTGVALQGVHSYTTHSFLPDYYRMSEAGLKALAEYAQLQVIHASMNQGPDPSPPYWFAISESILIARKPESPKQMDNNETRDFDLCLDWKAQRIESLYLGSFRNKKHTCTLVGPCHATAVSKLLALALPNFNITHIWWRPRNLDASAEIHSVDDANYLHSDILIVFDQTPVSDSFQGTLIRLPTIRFSAFHPDFFAPGPEGSRTSGSSIVAECFLRGYSEEKTLSMFNHHTYAKLGYYNAWDVECRNLKKTLKAVGMNLNDFLPNWLRQGVFMCDRGHPMGFVLKDIVGDRFKKLGIALDNSFTYNFFEYNMWGRLPVYPEIAESLGFPEAGSYRFRRTSPMHPPWDWEDSISLEEYVHLSYLDYSKNIGKLDNMRRLERLPSS